MFVGYGFERDFADKACTLEHVISQVGAGMGVYVFLQLSEVSEFVEMAQQYKGHVVWVEDVASGPLGFLVDRFSAWWCGDGFGCGGFSCEGSAGFG